MPKRDRLDLTRVVSALNPSQLQNLADRAELLGFPRDSWPALPAEVTVALSWASTAVAGELRLFNPSWSWNRCLDEAESTLLADAYGDLLGSRPMSVRSTYARWAEAVKPKPAE